MRHIVAVAGVVCSTLLIASGFVLTACDTSEPDEAKREAWNIWQADLFGQWVVDDYYGEFVESTKDEGDETTTELVAYRLHVGEGKVAMDTLVMRENNKLVVRKAKKGDRHLLDGYTAKTYQGDYSTYNYYDYKVYTNILVNDYSAQKSLEGASTVEFLPFTDKVSLLSFTIFSEDFLKTNQPYGYILYSKSDGYMYLYSGGLPQYRLKRLSDRI